MSFDDFTRVDAGMILCTGQFRDSFPSSHLCRLYRVEHQHGNSERTDAAGDGRDGSCNFSYFGMDVADQR